MEEFKSTQTFPIPEDKNAVKVAKDFGAQPPISKRKKLCREILLCILAGIIYAVGYQYFVSGARFAPGGIAGIVAMVQFIINKGNSFFYFGTSINFSSLLFVLLNVPLLAIALRTLSKNFIWKTLLATAVMSVLLFSAQFLPANVQSSLTLVHEGADDMGIRILAAIFGGVVSGTSLAIALRVNASTGGADIIGAILQKKNPHKSVASLIFSVNLVIVAISIPIYRDNLTPVLLALLYMFTSTKTCDMIMAGRKNALKFEVVTDYPEQISEEIIRKLGHGVTLTPAEGMYEHRVKSMLICVVQPRQIAKFRDILAKYPDTFAFVSTVTDVYGKFNENKRRLLQRKSEEEKNQTK